MPLPPVNRKSRQLRRIRLKVAGVPFIDDGNGIGAGVGADNAAKLEHDQRRMTERLSAKLSQLIPLGSAGGVGHHVRGVLHRIHAALDPFQHGSRHGGIAAHLCLDLRDTGVQADDGADATDNNQISVKIDAMSADGLGVKNLKVDGADDTNAKNAVETIKEAIQKVFTQRSALGAAQNRLEHTISNLDNVVENTTSAESQIRDTDMATKMVKYSKNNILAQAGQDFAQAYQNIKAKFKTGRVGLVSKK